MAEKQKTATQELVVLKAKPETQGPHAASSTEYSHAQLYTIHSLIRKYERAIARERRAKAREHDSNKWKMKRLLYARRHQKTPKLKPMPECTKKDPAPYMEIQISEEPVYAQLNPASRTETENENHYQPLSKATREKAKESDVGTSLAPSNGDDRLEEGINISSNDGNPQSADEEDCLEEGIDIGSNDGNPQSTDEDNCLEEDTDISSNDGIAQYKDEDFYTHFCFMYWKPIVGIGLVALTIILIWFSISISNIARGNDNAESYKELSGSVVTTSTTLAEQIVILQNQLNSSVIDQQAQFNSSLQASEALINQRILALQHNLTSLRQQQRTTLQEVTDLQSDVNRIRSTVNNLDSSVGRLDSRVNGINSDVGRLDSRVNGINSAVNGLDFTVNRLSTELEATTSRLDNKVGILSQNNMKLNISLLHVKTLVVPIGCNSQVYTTAEENATIALSESYALQSAQQSINCEATVYPAGSVPTAQPLNSTLIRLPNGQLRCECSWEGSGDQHYNSVLACSMVVTTC